MVNVKALGIPLAVAVALSVALGFVIDEPFGSNLAPYVGAVSTIVLVAVTLTSVLTTQEMAKTARDQLRLARNEPGRLASEAVYLGFVQAQLPAIKLGVAQRRYVEVVVNHPESAAAERRDLQAAATAARDFWPLVRGQEPKLPRSIVDRVHHFAVMVSDAVAMADALDEALWTEATRALSRSKTPDLSRVEAAWTAAVARTTADPPSWNQYLAGEETVDFMLSMSNCYGALSDYLLDATDPRP